MATTRTLPHERVVVYETPLTAKEPEDIANDFFAFMMQQHAGRMTHAELLEKVEAVGNCLIRLGGHTPPGVNQPLS